MKSMYRLMLLITENCNLNCRYCYEHRKNKKVMSFNDAALMIDEWLANADPEAPYVLEVFGGEAFVNFPLIRQIDDYIQKNYSHLNVKYETTTNGTLVHGEIQDWLNQNREKFHIAVSLDGTKQMHDINRTFSDGKGSFDQIDLAFFTTTWPHCPAKMTISDQTLPYMAEGVIYLDSMGFKCDTTLSVGVAWDQEKNLPVLMRQLEILANYYIQNPEKELCTLLNQDLRLIHTPIDADYRFCGAGVDMLCCDTSSNVYPCQGFAPVSIGEGAETFHEFDEAGFRFTKENTCRECSWVRLCPNCYAANLQSTGNIQKVDPDLCGLYRVCILASARIQYARIMQKREMTRDDQLVLKAIQIICNQAGELYGA